MKVNKGIISLLALAALVAVAVRLKQSAQHLPPPADSGSSVPGAEPEAAGGDGAVPGEEAPTALPRLLDLGSVGCLPCQRMAPILDELREDLRGRVVVEFVDVRKQPEVAKAHDVQRIPTQIFFDGAGEEVFRHLGFLSREEILEQLREMGVDLGDR